MLRLSKLADYGTVIMVYLARHPQQLNNARLIAQDTHFGVPTVCKLLKILAHAGLVISQRGTKGGYKLSRPADEISVAQIINAVEDNSGLTECSHNDSQCAYEPICVVRGNWQLLSRAIGEALNSVSLSALARPRFNLQDVNLSSIHKISQAME